MDTAAVSTVASVIGGFGVAMLAFRLRRELEMEEKGQAVWFPWADWLLVSATLSALLLVLLPLVVFDRVRASAAVAVAGCTSSLLFLSGYVVAILAHYRILWATGRTGPRDNPEPAERVLVYLTATIATLGFGLVCWAKYTGVI